MAFSIEQAFLSPYGIEYCTYFYFLTIISLVMVISLVFQSLYLLSKGKFNLVKALVTIAGPLVIYINNRLLYSMCQKSLN